MKVAGFSFIRNAVKFDYPIIEAITSILPLCNEFVVAVGDSEDSTTELIKQINSPKISIIPTIWDKDLQAGGSVLAVETNKALRAVASDADWAFYIQGDEVVHEQYLEEIHKAMHLWKDNPKVEGLLFKYVHFYGSYQYVGNSRRWYRNEIRIIRPRKDIFSYRDAQGFRKLPNQKLLVKPIEAYIYHYGWVKNPYHQAEKRYAFEALYHQKPIIKAERFDYQIIDSLELFSGSHPEVMNERINAADWIFEYDVNQKNYSAKVRLLMWIEQMTGWRIGEYKNYKLI